MDKELIEWSKTILLTQAMIPRLIRAITKENERLISLGFGSRHYNQGQSTYDFLDSMLKVNIRKNNLIKLHNDVNSILGEMNSEETTLLVDRFLKKKCVSELLPNMNIRTAYRRYDSALKHFAMGLARYGYTLDVLEDNFLDDKVISTIHKRVQDHAIVYRSEKTSDDIHINSEVLRPSKMNCIKNIALQSSIPIKMQA